MSTEQKPANIDPKLEKMYDQINSTTKTLEEQENQIIQVNLSSCKNYKMKEGDYKIMITIYQANDLQPKPASFLFLDLNKSACDPYVQIEIKGEKKKTAVRKETNNPIWQESFFWQFNNMSVQQLDNAKITINLYDKNHFFIKNNHIGSIQIDWTNIYFKRFHQIYRGWLTLCDPLQQIQGPTGYLLVNIAVLGPTDKIMVHDSAFIKDPLTTIQDTITNTKITLIDYGMTVQVYRAQNLIPLDLFSRSVDAFVVAKFSGNKVSTSIKSSLNPQWNQSLKIGAGVPTKTRYLTLEVWNRNRLSANDLIGSLKIPFVDICEAENIYQQPRWGHIYGPPMCAIDQPPSNYATKMQIYGQQLGSHYRGRLLYKIVGKRYLKLKTGKNELKFKFPFKPTPVVPLKTYTLSVELIEGFQLPQRQNIYIHVAIGQYLIKSNKPYKVQNKICEFHDILEDKKVQFPEDISQVPDAIIYICNGQDQKNRMCYSRIKAKTIQTDSRGTRSQIYQFQGDKSLHLLKSDQIGGYINCRVNLYTDVVPKNKFIESDFKDKFPYVLYFYLFKGQDFPPVNIEGDCDPMIKFNCFGKSVQSKPFPNSFNPMWNSCITMDLQMQNLFSTNITKGIVCQALDFQDGLMAKNQFIGSFLIKLNNKYLKKVENEKKKTFEMLYIKPKWYYIVNKQIDIGKNVFGKVLLSVALFKQQDIMKGIVSQDFLMKDKQLVKYQNKTIQLYIIGLRNIKDSSSTVLTKGKATLAMKIGKTQQLKFEDNQIKKGGCEINVLKQVQIQIPKNRNLIPFIDFKVIHNGNFYGFNSQSLYKLLPKLKDKQGMETNNFDSQQTILDVQGLQNQLNLLRQKKRKQKQKNLGDLKDTNIDIQELKIPMQLGQLHNEETVGNLEDYNKFIEQYQKRMIVAPQYQYVNQMIEKKKDLQQQQRKSMVSIDQEIQRKDKFYEHRQQEKQPLVSAPFKTHLSYQPSSRIMRDQQSGTGMGKSKFDVVETVFERKLRQIRQKQEKKSENKISQKHESQKQVKFKQQKQKSNNSQKMNKAQIKQQIINEPIRQKPQEQARISEHGQVLSQHKSQTKKILQAEKQKQKQIIYNNSEQAHIKNYEDADNKFKMGDQLSSVSDVHFDIRTQQSFSDSKVDERAIVYKDVKRAIQQQDRDQKQAIQRDAAYKFGQAVKLTLFGWNREKPKKNIQTYDDYDTEDGQDLNIIPQWYKGRKILTSDFQDLNFKAKKIQTVQLYGGRKVQQSGIRLRAKLPAGHVKFVILSQNAQTAKQKQIHYTKLLKQKEYYARIYILKGKSLVSLYEGKPSTYLKFYYADQTWSLKSTTLQKQQTNPQYYILQQIPIMLPGPAVVKIQVIQVHNIVGSLKEQVLGFTQIDIQQRYFMKKWHLYQKKPIQLRNLYSQYGIGSQGRLQTWIDLVQKKNWITNPAHKIHPPPFDKFQLRVIVWKTQDCVFKNVQMESNDVFVRATVGTSQPQETDTHWCCRSVGNFNYRFKYPVNYPPKPQDMYSDIFTVQIWDRDLVGYNNLIGQTRINLNKMHRMIQKAVKRKRPVKASMKIKQDNFRISDRFWFDVFNSKQKDQFGQPQVQGRVQLSFQLVPFQKAEKQLQNGYGRSQPNVYPTLGEPAGRFQFDFFSPLSMIKQIIGPKLFNKWCCRLLCCLLLVLLVFIGYLFLPSFIAVKLG